MALLGNPFDMLGDEDGDHEPTIINNICKKLEAVAVAKREAEEKEAAERALAAAKARGEVLDVVNEPGLEMNQTESMNPQSRSERGRGRGGRVRGNGRGGYGREQNGRNVWDNGYRRNYSGASNGITYDGVSRRGGHGRGGSGRGRGRSREKLSNDEDEQLVMKEENEGDEKQTEGVEGVGWKDIPESRQREYQPRDNSGRRGVFRRFNIDQTMGQQNYGGETDEYQKREGYENYSIDGNQAYGGEKGYQNSNGESRDGHHRRYDGKRRAYDGGPQYGGRRNGANQSADQSNVDALEANDSGDKEGGSGNNVPEDVNCKDSPDADQVRADAAEVSGDSNDEKKTEKIAKGDDSAKQAEQEEEKYLTLKEYEKLLSDKRKGLEPVRAEERKVTLDKDFEAMQLVEKKKEEDVFVQLKSDKGTVKTKDSLDKGEKVRKVVSINEFLKPGERQVFGQRRFGGRTRGLDRGGVFSQRGGGGRGEDFARNGGRRGGDSVHRNSGRNGQDFVRRNSGERGQDIFVQRDRGGRRDSPAGLVDYSQQGGRSGVAENGGGRVGGAGSGGNRYNDGYSRVRVAGIKAPDVADPGQFPALDHGGGLAVAAAAKA